MKDTVCYLSPHKKLVTISALVCVLLLVGCPEDIEKDPITPEMKEYITNLAQEIGESPDGGSVGNPVAVTVRDINLSICWTFLLTTIAEKGKYVELDLSACTMTGTVFYPYSYSTGRDKIVSLIVPDTARSIEGSADFSALRKVEGKNIESIGGQAFENCKSLETVNFPNVTSIGNSAFANCTALVEVNFPNVTSIGDSAFSLCSALKTANFPQATSIGDEAFDGCESLKTVIFPNADRIAELAKSLSESPNGHSTSNPVAVALTADFNVSNGWAYTNAYTNDWVYILNTIETADKYVALDLSACTMNGTEFDPYTGSTDKIVSLIVPDTARSIGGSGWTGHYYNNYSSALRKVEGKNIESIGGQAFENCKSLETVNFPKVTSIGGDAFAYCSALETVKFPEATSIGGYAFFGTALETANFPKVITIGDRAFGFCESLKTANFPQVTSIGYIAFENCDALTTVSFPNVTSIGDYAFDYCSALKEANFPQVTSIGIYAFRRCLALVEVNFPNVTTIGDYAFENCSALTTVSFPNVTSIGDYAFDYCRALETADFPEATTIGIYAFTDTGSMPLEIKLGAAAPTVKNMIFYDSYEKPVTVKVPSGATGYDEPWQTKFKYGSSITLTIETYNP
ncbi:hypothetical protein PilKf_00385 [Pillotina sp. SPG140]|jgi:hypothetical protein